MHTLLHMLAMYVPYLGAAHSPRSLPLFLPYHPFPCFPSTLFVAHRPFMSPPPWGDFPACNTDQFCHMTCFSSGVALSWLCA